MQRAHCGVGIYTMSLAHPPRNDPPQHSTPKAPSYVSCDFANCRPPYTCTHDKFEQIYPDKYEQIYFQSLFAITFLRDSYHELKIIV